MTSVLIAFASSQGQTEKIVQQIGSLFEATGVAVSLVDLDVAGPAAPAVAAADGIILAASVHGGQHQFSAFNFALAHHDSLGSKPSAFLSVSLAAAGTEPNAVAQTTAQIESFLEKCRWTPEYTVPLAGAIRYSSQPRFVRWWLRLLQKLMGRRLSAQGFPDVTQDAEFTDWHRVEDFVARFCEKLRGSLDPAKAAPQA